MSGITEKELLIKIYEVVKKLASIAKTQSFRFNQKWEDYLKPFNEKPHTIRTFSVEREDFIQDINYRIEVLSELEKALVDGFYAIKSLLETLYGTYFDSEIFREDFTPHDQKVIKYLTAKEILGNLMQYNKMDHETVPLKYNVIARNYTMMKLEGMESDEITENLKKLQIELTDEELNDVMEELKADEIVEIIEKDEKKLYKIKTVLELSEEGQRKYNQLLYPLISWPTQLWRSFYNVRELNVTPPEGIKYRDFLDKVLSRSATQGFGPTDFVIKNLIKYFEKLNEASGS